jgi:hypothetical protein
MANLHYLAADSLNMPLKFKDSKLWGNERKSFTLGPWNIDIWLHARSDVMGKNECSVWVSVTKRLWLYLMIDTKKGTRLAVFDAKECGITLDNCETWGDRTIQGTLDLLGTSVKASYQFKEEMGWTRQLAS